MRFSNRLIRSALLLLGLALHVHAAVLVPTQATWRWRPGTNEASTPVTLWREVGFADPQFTTAPAPFWYGDVLPGGTQISGMQNVYGCIFLRTKFVVTNLAEIGGLRLGSLVDDGFVAWINGTEVLRVNMPGGAGTPVTTATLANNALEPVSFTMVELPAPPSYLLPGTNVLAVQVFQSSLGSSDLGFECSLESVVDQTASTVADLVPGAGATVRSLTSVTVFFSEPVLGVDAADLLINQRPAAAVTPVVASQYIFTFPQPPTGVVQMAWAPGHGITDQATLANAFAGGAWSYRLDPDAAEPQPYISEFLASNTRGLADENGSFEDWIEIHNPTPGGVNLDGWYLTDNAANLTKWRFPATNVAGGKFLVVFASGKDQRVPGARLHTSFQLSAGGEYLALVKPDGVTVVSEFAPAFPRQVPDVSYGFAQAGSPPNYPPNPTAVYFTTPTPGAVNLGGSAVPGPVIEAVQHTPNVPLDPEDLLVTARVRPSFRAIGSVTLRYRIMFGTELSTAMLDDGAHGDGAAGDGVYGAMIPANLSTNGQMIRYLIAATDVNANGSRWPLFTDPLATEEYLGTVVNPTNLTSKLPIFHLFVAPGQMSGIDTESGGRIAFFYDGEFYDNVYMELRGNTSAGLPKKTHRLEFNRGHELRHAGPGGRSRRSALMAEMLDPAYLRQHLCFWFLDRIGVPAPYDYPVRVQMNGAFYQLAFHSDVIGKEQMERMGYDPLGALYKAVGNLVPNFSSTGVFQKLEPENDPSRTDYLELANGINEASSLALRRATVFDLLDVPQVINHLAGARWCAENDDVWANMSIYRDTYGDGRWRCIPFDMNASWGQLYGGSNPLEATADFSKSHPLYGGASTGGNYNRLYDVIVTLPETRQMLLRRERSILDQMVQPPGTPADRLIIENYINSLSTRISAEAMLDRARWGDSPWAPGKTFAQGIADLRNQYVGPRRRHWYVTHCLTNTSRPIGIGNANNAGIPLSQPPNLPLTVVGVDFNPAGGNQEQEYVCLSNAAPFAVDLTGWKLTGGIDFTFAPGTVLPSNSVAYVSPNPRAFQARATGPRGGQGLFVLGPYQGQLSARGELLSVQDPLGLTLGTFAYAGAPSPAQQFLRITEIMFHPAAPAGSPIFPDEFEYLELRNLSPTVTLELTGVRLVNGVDFNFTGSAVTSLAPGARVLVVKNRAAFAARYGSDLPVAGQFNDNLDNAGERLQLLDASNEEILDFSYRDDWYPLTDGLGFSLVVVDEAAEPNAWGRKSQWRPSSAVFGSPGSAEPAPPVLPPVLITEAFTRTDTPPPLDTVELYNPTAQTVDVGGWWLTDDFNTPAKFRVPPGTTLAAQSYLTFDESQFNAGGAGFGLSSEGDELWLFSADAVGNLTGYVHGHRFGAAEDGVSFGRHLTSDGQEHFVPQAARSLGSANSGPRVGPVVINEIMYRPPDLSEASDNSADEYVELLNTSVEAVALFDADVPPNAWRLRVGVEFDFPSDLTLAGGEAILLVNFNPTNAVMADAFRSKYGLAAGVRLFGPYLGKLDNSGDDLELQKPTVPRAGIVAHVVADEVTYRDAAPWPGGADGFGLSLQRRSATAYGNDPANWLAAPPTAAAPTATGVVPVITAQPQSRSLVAYQPVSFSVNATGGAPLRYQWRWNGTLLAGATNAILWLDSARPEQAGRYDVLVFNPAGSAVSSNAILALAYPATILAQPQSVAARPGNNVTLTVAAYSPGAMSYQWRKNGVNLPGATAANLSLRDVQFADAADYTVVITDPVGPVTSAPATLTLLIDPIVTQSPLGQQIVPGSTIVLSVSVTNTATRPIGYQLYRNGSPIPPSVPGAFVTLSQPDAYFTLSGADTMPPWNNYSILVTNAAKPSGNLTAAAMLFYAADNDGDGLADSWETQFFGGPGADSSADSDHDGSSNQDEYSAGTDPQAGSSYLRIDALTAPPGGTLSFVAIASRTYTVQFTDALGTAPWQKLADVPARSIDRVVDVADPSYATNRAYRLVTPRQP